MPLMRAKFRVSKVEVIGTNTERIHFNAVAASQYPADGSDENNSFARWSPSATCTIDVANPSLHDLFEAGQQYYVDFRPDGEARKFVGEASFGESGSTASVINDQFNLADAVTLAISGERGSVIGVASYLEGGTQYYVHFLGANGCADTQWLYGHQLKATPAE